MKVQGRERIAFNFKGLLKAFVSNDSAIAEDEEVEQEVKRMIEQEDKTLIHKLEASTAYNGRIKSGKNNNRINLESTKTKQVERNSKAEGRIEEKERD